jgi:hypothetical protein
MAGPGQEEEVHEDASLTPIRHVIPWIQNKECTNLRVQGMWGGRQAATEPVALWPFDWRVIIDRCLHRAYVRCEAVKHRIAACGALA